MQISPNLSQRVLRLLSPSMRLPELAKIAMILKELRNEEKLPKSNKNPIILTYWNLKMMKRMI